MSDAVIMLERSIEIAATPARVWELVSDVCRMPEWSPQVTSTRLRRGHDRCALGAQFTNRNRHGELEWTTHAQIVRFAPERELAFRIEENWAIWSFHLEPAGADGTLLTQRRETPDGISDLSLQAHGRIHGRRAGLHQDSPRRDAPNLGAAQGRRRNQRRLTCTQPSPRMRRGHPRPFLSAVGHSGRATGWSPTGSSSRRPTISRSGSSSSVDFEGGGIQAQVGDQLVEVCSDLDELDSQLGLQPRVARRQAARADSRGDEFGVPSKGRVGHEDIRPPTPTPSSIGTIIRRAMVRRRSPVSST